MRILQMTVPLRPGAAPLQRLFSLKPLAQVYCWCCFFLLGKEILINRHGAFDDIVTVMNKASKGPIGTKNTQKK